LKQFERIVDLRNNCFDIICTNRENILKATKRLFPLGWVPIPIANETIKNYVETNYGEMRKIIRSEINTDYYLVNEH